MTADLNLIEAKLTLTSHDLAPKGGLPWTLTGHKPLSRQNFGLGEADLEYRLASKVDNHVVYTIDLGKTITQHCVPSQLSVY